mgnify:FL=1
MLTGKILEGEIVSYCPQFLQQINEPDSKDMKGVIKEPDRKGMIVVSWFGGGRSIVKPVVLVRRSIRD